MHIRVQCKHTHIHTCAAVESQATGGMEILNEKLGQDDFINPQRVVPILPVKHQVVLIIRIYRDTERERRETQER